jgi:hypothetical protein
MIRVPLINSKQKEYIVFSLLNFHSCAGCFLLVRNNTAFGKPCRRIVARIHQGNFYLIGRL